MSDTEMDRIVPITGDADAIGRGIAEAFAADRAAGVVTEPSGSGSWSRISGKR